MLTTAPSAISMDPLTPSAGRPTVIRMSPPWPPPNAVTVLSEVTVPIEASEPVTRRVSAVTSTSPPRPAPEVAAVTDEDPEISTAGAASRTSPPRPPADVSVPTVDELVITSLCVAPRSIPTVDEPLSSPKVCEADECAVDGELAPADDDRAVRVAARVKTAAARDPDLAQARRGALERRDGDLAARYARHLKAAAGRQQEPPRTMVTAPPTIPSVCSAGTCRKLPSTMMGPRGPRNPKLAGSATESVFACWFGHVATQNVLPSTKRM